MQKTDPLVRYLGSAGDIQLGTFVLAIGLPLRPNIGSYPLATITAAVLVMIALLRPARDVGNLPRIVTLPLFMMVVWLMSGPVLAGHLETRRMGNVAIVVALAWVLAQGRLHVPSVVWGAGLGLGLGVTHAILTIGSSTYTGRITGQVGDPNGVGFTVSTLGCLLIAMVAHNRLMAIAVWVLAGGAILLTVSRTSIFAFVMATGWAFLAPRIGKWPSFALLATGTPVFNWASEFAERQETFVDRVGSDVLRSELVAAEKEKIADAGFFGNGLGDTKVFLEGKGYWFHNGFYALRVEGGTLAYGLFGVAMIGLFWCAFKIPKDRRNAWFEASILAGLICSVNIGYSLISVISALALGVFLNYWRENIHQVDSLPSAYGNAARVVSM